MNNTGFGLITFGDHSNLYLVKIPEDKREDEDKLLFLVEFYCKFIKRDLTYILRSENLIEAMKPLEMLKVIQRLPNYLIVSDFETVNEPAGHILLSKNIKYTYDPR